MKIATLNPLRLLDSLSAKPRPKPSPADDARRAALLLRACACIRLADLDQAETLLACGLLDAADAARLNLLGVVCEKRGRWDDARRFYGRSIRADRTYAPPRQNIRRWFELDTFGRSQIPVTLGDEEPEWWCARRLVTSTDAGQTGLRLTGVGVTSHDN